MRQEGRRRSDERHQTNTETCRAVASTVWRRSSSRSEFHRHCLLIDISDSGVRFTLTISTFPRNSCCSCSANRVVRESTYKVVWRRGHDVGAPSSSMISASTYEGAETKVTQGRGHCFHHAVHCAAIHYAAVPFYRTEQSSRQRDSSKRSQSQKLRSSALRVYLRGKCTAKETDGDEGVRPVLHVRSKLRSM